MVGSGFIARNFAAMIQQMGGHQYNIVSILTRREIGSIGNFPYEEKLTNSSTELIDKSDLILECSGDVIQATKIAIETFEAGLPLLTMNSEFHVTTGSYFSDKGYLSECHGDQPGCIAALKEEVELMGFKPLILGNFKGYLNTNPTKEDMTYWAKKQGFTVKQTTSFTDGTKVQIEQAFAANAHHGSIFEEGLLGPKTHDFVQTAQELAARADESDQLIAEYIISDSPLPSGIFIVGKQHFDQQQALATYKLGDGPYYVLHTTYHLCSFEILKTINRYLLGLPPLLKIDKSPNISVAAIAKKQLDKDLRINSAIGSFDCRGSTVFAEQHSSHVPIGILENAIIKRTVEPGQIITYDDVELEESSALHISREIFEK